MIVEGCTFEGITCSNDEHCMILNDEMDSCDVSMINISIKDSDSGHYHSDHASHSSITMSHVVVESSRVWTDENDAFLLFVTTDSVLL